MEHLFVGLQDECGGTRVLRHRRGGRYHGNQEEMGGNMHSAGLGSWVRQGDVAVSAAVGLPFAVYLVILNALVDPERAQWGAADPILKLAPESAILWGVPAATFALAALWWARATPGRDEIARGLKWAAAGAIASLAVMALLRLAVGPSLPGFIPPEESSAPGFLLSMTAGFGEEVLFRLLLLPVLFFALQGPVGNWRALVVATALTSMSFALLHEVGVWTFEPQHVMSRAIVPGALMSLAWFASPSFIIAAHACAHLAIPLFFAS